MRNDVKGFIPVTLNNSNATAYVNIRNINDIVPSNTVLGVRGRISYAENDFIIVKETVEEVLSLIQANNQKFDNITALDGM